MINFQVKVKSIQRIPDLKLKPAQTRIVTAAAIQAVKDRVQLRHTDVFDVPMPAYSDKPVYVRLGESSKFSTGRVVIKQGRIPIASVNALRNAGANIIKVKGRAPLGGEFRNKVVQTGKSLRFPNRAAYKRFLGRSGLRDLTETGAMLAAIGVISQSGIYAKVIVIGFRNDKQRRKAQGNVRYANWFGLSPTDEVRLTRLVNDILAENLGLPKSYTGSRSLAEVTLR